MWGMQRLCWFVISELIFGWPSDDEWKGKIKLYLGTLYIKKIMSFALKVQVGLTLEC